MVLRFDFSAIDIYNVDEYDNFTNKLLLNSRDDYLNSKSGITAIYLVKR